MAAEEDLSALYKEKKIYNGIDFKVKQAILLMVADFISLGTINNYNNVLVMLGLEEHLYVQIAQKIVERMSGRRLCSACGASFHVKYKPSAVENVCDKCGAALFIRSDDEEATVKHRLETYHKQTEPLKDFYSKRGLLISVEGQEELADTTKLVSAALAKFEK